jgi:glutathione-regulated potassium-efflux system protein KefB
MAAAADSTFLVNAAVYLGAAAIAVPIFTRAKLGAILGYLAAGILIGPYALGLISGSSTESVRSFAEFGVVLLLFVIGLELRPSRLWAMRREIFGLGLSQLLLSGALLGVSVGLLLGLSWKAAVIIGPALALSSTAFAVQVFKERGELNTPKGETAFSILLFQDLAIVPLLALVALLAGNQEAASTQPGWLKALIMIAAVGGVIIAGRYLLTPLFRLIAQSGAREALAAAALLIVVGTAALMNYIGLSMALGAFLAGVMLAESEFRHQLEADIEPFRGLLLGLFFIAIGMGLDLSVVKNQALLLLALVAIFCSVKFVSIFAVLRFFKTARNAALGIAAAIAQGGEFGFVLFGQALAAKLIDAQTASLLTAAVTISMALTPLLVMLMDRLTCDKGEAPDITGAEVENAEHGSVIVAGFGRMGQVVAQMCRARGIKVTCIDSKSSQIELSRRFGAQVYYGDGRRADVLRAAGAGDARLLVFCQDGTSVSQENIDAIRMEFPTLTILARAYDRRHALALMKADVDFIVRETFESGVTLGKETLRRLDVPDEIVTAIEDEFRKRDAERLALQSASGDLQAGRDLIFKTEEPFAPPAFDIGPTDFDSAPAR